MVLRPAWATRPRCSPPSDATLIGFRSQGASKGRLGPRLRLLLRKDKNGQSSNLYKFASGYLEPYGDYFELDIDATGRRTLSGARARATSGLRIETWPSCRFLHPAAMDAGKSWAKVCFASARQERQRPCFQGGPRLPRRHWLPRLSATGSDCGDVDDYSLQVGLPRATELRSSLPGMDTALLVLTGVLAFATLVYAGFAGWAAYEMRASRQLSIRPSLALMVVPYSPTGGHLALTSLGPGTAVDVDVTIRFDPLGESRPWRTDVLRPGDRVEFLFPGPQAGAPPFDFAELGGHNVHVRLTGSMKDVEGEAHEVEDEIDAVAWSTIIEQSGQLYVRDPTRIVAEELEEIRKVLSSKGAAGDAS
jgi:hypothetical protein